MSTEARTFQVVQIELSQACQEIGFLQYQIEREIPAEIEKKFNIIHDLQKELQKMQRAQDAAAEKLKAQSSIKPVDINKIMEDLPQANEVSQ